MVEGKGGEGGVLIRSCSNQAWTPAVFETQATAGYYHSAVLLASGSVYAFGRNDFGEACACVEEWEGGGGWPTDVR